MESSTKRTRWAASEPENWEYEISPGSHLDEYLLSISERGQAPHASLTNLPFLGSTYDSLVLYGNRIARLGEKGVIQLEIDQETLVVRYNEQPTPDYADWDGTVVRIERSRFRAAMDVADLTRPSGQL